GLTALPYLVLPLLGLAAWAHAWYYSPALARFLFCLKIVAPSLATLALMGLLAQAWARAAGVRARRQVAVVGLGIALGFGPAALWAVAFAGGYQPGDLSPVLACMAALPLSIGYAMLSCG